MRLIRNFVFCNYIDRKTKVVKLRKNIITILSSVRIDIEHEYKTIEFNTTMIYFINAWRYSRLKMNLWVLLIKTDFQIIYINQCIATSDKLKGDFFIYSKCNKYINVFNWLYFPYNTYFIFGRTSLLKGFFNDIFT